MKAVFVITLLALVFCLRLTQSANILGVFAYAFSTPYLVVIPYVKALMNNGHNVTIISSAEILPDIDGVRHIRIPKLDETINSILNFDFTDEYVTNKWKEAILRASFFYNISESIFSNERVQSLLQDEQEHFDLVLLDPTHTTAFHGFAEHFNAFQVGLAVFGSNWLVDYLSGNSAPSVYRPISSLGYSFGNSLVDRWNNWVFIAQEWLIDRLMVLPPQLQLFQRYFNFSAQKFYERRRDFSLMLINQHFSLGRTRSNAPNVIEVAGLHMAYQAPELDVELKQFLDEAKDGVIYFSMGLEILTKWLPPNIEQKLLETFSKLKQRIVWKHEMGMVTNKSDNIYINTFIPQRRLLEHPNTKLFLTNGGLLSIIEAAYAGVPMLGLPIYFDQFDNVARICQIGVGLQLDINTLTVKQLTEGIKELLQNRSYARKAKEMSLRFRDQPMSPLESAVWWTEYVIRHKGAAHMRLPERDLSFVSDYGINIITVLFGRIGFSALIIIFLICSVINATLTIFRKRSVERHKNFTNSHFVREIGVGRKEKMH